MLPRLATCYLGRNHSMANQKRSSTRGIKNQITSIIMVTLGISVIFSIIKVNDINSIEEGMGFLRGLSKEYSNCAKEENWKCDKEINISPEPVDVEIPEVEIPEPDAPSLPENDKDAASFDVDKVTGILDSITPGTKNEDIEYVRSEWKHWTGSPCNARQQVLIAQGEDVKSDKKTCKIISGKWNDPYNTEYSFTDSSKIDVDHVIPLGYAARYGGQEWSSEKKEKFANDLSQLLAVSASENRSKSDKGPSEYMPANKAFHCEYSKIWVTTAKKYELTIDEKDKKALQKTLRKCD